MINANDEILELSTSELVQLIRYRKISAKRVMQTFIDRCERFDHQLNVFAHSDYDGAINQAESIDRLLSEGYDTGPLSGIPIGVKDLIAVRDMPLAFGCRLFFDEVATQDAPSVARLRKAGACILGKTTTSELGSKAVGHSPLTGHTLNPWDRTLTAGGSSAGAAAGVAARMFPVALGTDGGGSSRIPASFCGVAGFKPTFGRVPVWPISATPTLAHIGILANRASDIEPVLSAIQGFDRRDPFSYPLQPEKPADAKSIDAVSIGWCPSVIGNRAVPEVEAMVHEWFTRVFGAGRDEVVLESEYSLGELWNVEFFGGIQARLGRLADSPELDPSLTAALQALPQDAHDVRRLVRQRLSAIADIDSLFDRHDFVCTPCTPTAAPEVGINQPIGMERFGTVDWSYFTYPFNLSGHPAISLPVALSESGKPIGLQLVGRKHDDVNLLSLARRVEEEIKFLGRYPLSPI
jgi:aspartyl-tRNA(Asn)/glutamyl-tRNA(Gln) amidotransferase subunit A